MADETKKALVAECVIAEAGDKCYGAACSVCKDTIKDATDKAMTKVIDLDHLKSLKCTKCGIRVEYKDESVDLAINCCKHTKNNMCSLDQLNTMIKRMAEKNKGVLKTPALLLPQPKGGLNRDAKMPTHLCPMGRGCWTGGCGQCRNEVRQRSGATIDIGGIMKSTKQYLEFGKASNDVQVETKPTPLVYEEEVEDVIKIIIDKKGYVHTEIVKE